MQLRRFQIDPVSVIEISGDFGPDHGGFRSGLQAHVDDVLGAGGRKLIVHLDIEFLDAVGFAILLAEAHKVRSAGGRLAIYSNRPRLQQIFRMIKCDLPSFLFDSQEAALCYVVYGTVLRAPKSSAAES